MRWVETTSGMKGRGAGISWEYKHFTDSRIILTYDTLFVINYFVILNNIHQ